jgi:hypothetical protein
VTSRETGEGAGDFALRILRLHGIRRPHASAVELGLGLVVTSHAEAAAGAALDAATATLADTRAAGSG